MTTNATVDRVDSVTTKVTINIPAEQVTEKKKESLKKLSKSAKIKGFRPGKAPADMVEKMYGDKILEDVKQDLFANSLSEVVKEHEIEYIGEPTLSSMDPLEEGKELSFAVEFAHYPNPKIGKYDSFTVETPPFAVEDKDVDATIERMQDSQATFTEIADRKVVEKNDTIELTIYDEGVDEAAKKKAQEEPVKLTLNGKELMEALEVQIIGAVLGETKTVVVENPDKQDAHSCEDESCDHEHHADKAEKKAHNVSILVHKILKKNLPELTDAFAASVDAEVKTALELKQKVRKLLQEDKDRAKKAHVEQELMKQLAKENVFELPQIMVDMEIKNFLMTSGMVDPNKMDLSKISAEPFRETLGEQAAERVRSSVVLDKIAEAEKIEIGEGAVKEFFAEESIRTGVPEQQIAQFYSDKSRVQSLYMRLTKQKALDFLLEKTKVKEVAPKAA